MTARNNNSERKRADGLSGRCITSHNSRDQGWRGEGGREAGAVSIYSLSKQVDVLQTAHCLRPPLSSLLGLFGL